MGVSMDIVGLIIQLIAGAVGGNVAGKANTKFDMGGAGNSIVGAIGAVAIQAARHAAVDCQFDRLSTQRGARTRAGERRFLVARQECIGRSAGGFGKFDGRSFELGSFGERSARTRLGRRGYGRRRAIVVSATTTAAGNLSPKLFIFSLERILLLAGGIELGLERIDFILEHSRLLFEQKLICVRLAAQRSGDEHQRKGQGQRSHVRLMRQKSVRSR